MTRESICDLPSKVPASIVVILLSVIKSVSGLNVGGKVPAFNDVVWGLSRYMKVVSLLN